MSGANTSLELPEVLASISWLRLHKHLYLILRLCLVTTVEYNLLAFTDHTLEFVPERRDFTCAGWKGSPIHEDNLGIVH